jgi:gliding motility-associated-like protein
LRELKDLIAMLLRNFIFILSFLSLASSYSQNIRRTDNWYFGVLAGVNFSSGNPVALHDGKLWDQTPRGCVTMSDTNGNLLFYSNGWHTYNKNHAEMTTLFSGLLTQQIISFLKPGSEDEYYLFSVPYFAGSANYYMSFYAIIDMSANGGLGAAGPPVILDAAWDAAEKLTAVYHHNRNDIWVITRKFFEDKFAAFLVTANGVNPTPVLSQAPHWTVTLPYGIMKISYNKKYLITCFEGGLDDDDDGIEVCRFNDSDGTIEYLYCFRIRDNSYPGSMLLPFGVEFSPDSRYLYITTQNPDVDGTGQIYQFDVQNIEDSALFVSSKIKIGIGKEREGIQLSSDGRIYVTGLTSVGETEYLGVINNPWKNGPGCDYHDSAVYLVPGIATQSLPSILTDYLYRFTFEGDCEGEPFSFTQYFNPVPTEILWNFGDPASGMSNNISNELNPIHVFSDGGIFNVWVRATYPDGRIEETSREVEVFYAPEPNLGPDTIICEGSLYSLNAYCGPHLYTWNTGAFSSSITVADSGLYWVNVTTSEGCSASDSIRISFFPKADIDNSTAIISPTTCGGAMGAITGVQVTGAGPFSYSWINDDGDTIAHALDIFHLSVGNYRLVITDYNGCITISNPYSITDAGDVLIQSVEFQPEHCSLQDGSIHIEATAGLETMLFYTIDNGQTYFTNQGKFDSLSPGSYIVRVKDSSDCQCVYSNNPVVIPSLEAPNIQQIQVIPSSSGNNDGGILLLATGNSDSVFYSINSGSTFQINNGTFLGLSPGMYICVVMDEWGCDTSFLANVPIDYSYRLEAIAGDDDQCPGNSAFVPLMANNFSNVAGFRASLNYNPLFLECSGYTAPHSQLIDSLQIILFPDEGRIEISWGSGAVSLPDSVSLVTLVFETVNTGFSNIIWDEAPANTQFLDSLGNIIPADLYPGTVKIYKELKISIDEYQPICQGDDISLSPFILASNGEVNVKWTDPQGNENQGYFFDIEDIQVYQSGDYHLLLTDTAGCQCNATINVEVYPSPAAAFAGTDTLDAGGSIELDAGSGFASYLWSTGKTSQTIMVQDDGWYNVSLTSPEGCQGKDSVFVRFIKDEQPPVIYLPNAFTPNGDGINDYFLPVVQVESLDYFRMVIYNRWGIIIYDSTDPVSGWDGLYKGKPVSADLYVYRIEYSFANGPSGNPELIQGTFMLVR